MGKTEHSMPIGVLDDLCSRFIINLPKEEREELVRVCFQIELAYWFYLDFYCTEEKKMEPCSMKDFAAHIFNHVPSLKPHAANLDSVLDQWKKYKNEVPTFGAILLNEDLTQMLLVQGYSTKSSWGFPKGKMNKDEEPMRCAVREVFEETGFDISTMVNENEYIESTINEQYVRLYIVGGVKKDTVFKPRTRKEIKSVEWFPVADIPSKKTMTPKGRTAANMFFMVAPFIKRIRRWIAEKQQQPPSQQQLQLQQQQQPPPKFDRNKIIIDVDDSQSSKNRKQQQFSQALQADIHDIQMIRQQKSTAGPRSPSHIVQKNDNVRGRKAPFKRQLFVDDEKNSGKLVVNSGIGSTTDKWGSPSWANFRFDYEAIMKCFD
ncbi:m7GpppN-mRNA hydrolase [Schistocerca serialis cubense]|uniref:m7GpppN-mRNA hydrolase n=1 Tax=Schistocerca serialis cubense TaxID=2023355 RepID=UPI00214EAD00|nr:m7GpppN-mRNA hydrolase [Schistocerca serialis cubense]